MDRPTGPALWILLCFCLYAIVLTLFFTIKEESGIPTEKIYIIARDASWQPFDFVDKDQEITAFSDELLIAVAEEQGIRIRIQPTSPANLFPGLVNENYQGILTSRLPEGAIQSRFFVSPTYYSFGPVIIAPVHSTIHSTEQLKGKFVGITESVESLMQFPTDPSTTYISYSNLSDALSAMADGAVQAIISERVVAESYLNSLYQGKFEVVSAPLNNLGLRLFTRRDYDGIQLMNAFTQGLHRLRDDGTYAALLKKWGLTSKTGLYSEPDVNTILKLEDEKSLEPNAVNLKKSLSLLPQLHTGGWPYPGFRPLRGRRSLHPGLATLSSLPRCGF